MPRRYPKRSQHKYTKKPYRVRNWNEYETALRNRGDLTLWFSQDAIEAWHAPACSKPGGQWIYSDLAIEAALTVRLVYGLALRQTEGFLRSVSMLLDLSIRIPDHSTLSRRSKQLELMHWCSAAVKGPIHILIDSTGLKVHSGNTCASGPPKRRMWRKLHLVVDAETGDILTSELTTHRARDAAQVPDLLGNVDQELASVTADGAYDVATVYEAVDARGLDPPTPVIIPPRRNARLSQRSTAVTGQRDHNIRWINAIGQRRWQQASGYTRPCVWSCNKAPFWPRVKAATSPDHTALAAAPAFTTTALASAPKVNFPCLNLSRASFLGRDLLVLKALCQHLEDVELAIGVDIRCLDGWCGRCLSNAFDRDRWRCLR